MECFIYHSLVFKSGLLAKMHAGYEIICMYYIKLCIAIRTCSITILVLFPTHRFVNVMVTTLAMIVAGVNLAIMDQTVANHKYFLDNQLPLTLMKSVKNSLRLFDYYVYMILATLLFWKNLTLVIQTC